LDALAASPREETIAPVNPTLLAALFDAPLPATPSPPATTSENGIDQRKNR
jgi:hypothetical protein